ncbi:MAG: hypothetical protein JO293_06495 [Candidatus Eremiobacteraeota bacterium]|nr:hypothetical protein [Candidatus Eremiobacteraeota bacterium]
MSGDEPATPVRADPPQVDESLVTYTHVIYGLHALAVLVGLTTFHTVVGSFIGGLPSIVAVIMNYARRGATRGTYLESHFRWQIRTFWFAVLWACLAMLLVVSIVLALVGLLGFAALAIWIIYRVARGWLALNDKRAMYL